MRLLRGTLGCIRNRKTEEKIIQNRKTAKKFGQNRKPQKNSAKTENRIQNRQETDTMVTSGAYRANYTNTLFHHFVFVNVMDLSKAFISFSMC